MTDANERDTAAPRHRKAAENRKRASGESSIVKGADGRFHGYVSMGLKENGKRDRRHVAAIKRGDVVRRVRELEEQRDAGIRLAGGRTITVEQWLDHWLTAIAVRRLRPKTYGNHSCNIRRHLTRLLGHHRLDRLQPEHVETALGAALGREPVAGHGAPQPPHRIAGADGGNAARPRRAQRRHLGRRAVRRPRGGAAAHGRRGEGAPAGGPKRAQRCPLVGGPGPRPAARRGAGPAVGCRRPRRRDPHRAPRATAASREGPRTRRAKSRAGRRTIKLPDALRDALRSHRAWQAERHLAAGNVWEDGGYVFCQPNGRPIDARRDWLDWKALLKVAGVRDARLHDARHTAATLLLRQGVPARVAMQVLGHSQISLTLGTYSHVVPELAQDAADRMGDALWG
jgi:integrase